MPRPAKVTRVSQATREKIIKAASRAFALNGYEGASVRTIVAEAQVNQAAINYHFGSKEGLYRAVLETSPLPPLPFAYSGTFLGVHLTFK